MSRTFRRSFPFAALAALVLAVLAPAAADAQPGTTYRVTITNLTESQPVSPPVVVTHSIGVHLFVPGEPAPAPLVPIAEEGDPTELVAALEAIGSAVLDVAVGDGPLMPGESTTVEVQARGKAIFLSAVGMLGTTNDAFFGLDGFFLRGHPWNRHVLVPAYDAGSEENNELCEFVPGPPCGGTDSRATAEAEGFVTVHSGIHGIGDLAADDFDWHNPVVRIQVTRLPDNRGGNGNGDN